MRRRPYDIVYDASVSDQVAAIERKYHSLIEKTISEQLAYDPQVESKNRKPLVRPSALGTAWELRFGPENRFRVFYRADESARRVQVLAVGVKTGNKLRVGGREFEV
jgi:hypothetical protein